MKIKEIYELAIERGIEFDLRGREEITKMLKRQRQEYEEMPDGEKEEFDQEKFFNPFSDTRVLFGDPETEVKHVLTGIDMEIGEVLLADRLREKGRLVDLIISHHPEGKALAALHEVMYLQEDLLHRLGVPINVAEGIMDPRINEVRRSLMPVNHNRAVDAARLLDIPLMSVHTPADNHVTSFLTNLIEDKQPETVRDVVRVLKTLPEYREAIKGNAGPQVVVGSEKRRAGKVFVDMTGGTGGSKKAFEKLADSGIGTLVVMHIAETHRKEAEKHYINVIIAGHMASDSLGMNLFLDELEKQGIKITACSGLIRFSRL